MNEQLKCIIRLQEVFCVRITDIAYLLNISKDEAYDCLDDKNISKSILSSLNNASCSFEDSYRESSNSHFFSKESSNSAI